MTLKEFLETLNKEDTSLNEVKKWMAEIDKDNSLRDMLGVKEDETILDVSNEKIIDAIKKHGLKAERKLVAYANMVGTHSGEKYKKEKERILNLVKKYGAEK